MLQEDRKPNIRRRPRRLMVAMLVVVLASNPLPWYTNSNNKTELHRPL
jgi:hypothetical protein